MPEDDIPKGDIVYAIVGEVANHVDHYEASGRLRQRARRRDDEARYRILVERLVCGVIHSHVLHGEPVAIAVGNDALGDSGRYSSPVLAGS